MSPTTIFSFKEEIARKSKEALLISYVWLFTIIFSIEIIFFLFLGPYGPSISLPVISLVVISMFAPHILTSNELLAAILSAVLLFSGIFLWTPLTMLTLAFFKYLPTLLSLIFVPLFYLGISVYPLMFYSYKKPSKVVDRLLKSRDPDLKNPKEKQALDIFNNLKIAFGIHNVELKILPWNIINAMAVSSKKKNVIYLTEGAIEKLDYYELEGVLAHEFSHIKNQDSYYMTLITIVAGLSILFAWFLAFELPKLLLKTDDRERKEGGIVIGLAILSFIIGILLYILTPFVMSKIYSFISKKREILADITAVLTTKYPDGLVNALVKVAKEDTSKFMKEKKLPRNIQALLFDYEVETHPKIWQRLEYLHTYAGAPLPKEYEELKEKNI